MGSAGVLNFDITFIHEMIFNWICAGIVSVVLYKLLYNPVGKLLKDRRDRIADNFARAGERMKEAESVKAEYEERLRDIETECAEILEGAARRAAERERLIVKAARSEAKAVKNRAIRDIEMEKEQARDEMKRQIIETAALMTAKIIEESLDETFARSVTDKSIDILEGIEWTE